MFRVEKSTLYFCGNEYIIKSTVFCVVGVVTKRKITNGLAVLLYSFGLLLLAWRCLVPFRRKLLLLLPGTLPRRRVADPEGTA